MSLAQIQIDAEENAEPFSVAAWRHIEPIRAAVEKLPLLEALSSGALDGKVFKHYILQDALYLKEYARALSIVASKAPDGSQMLRFLGSAQTALLVEQHLHASFLQSFGVTAEDIENTQPSPSAFAYTSFVMSVVQSSSYAVGLTAILPCFWIYCDVGEKIKALPSVADNPYQAWIDTYGDPKFAESTREVIRLTDLAASSNSVAERRRMLEVFTRASQYEWLFWQSAWTLETWAV